MRRLTLETSTRRSVAVSLAIAVAIPTSALAKTESGVNVSLGAAVASNPFQAIVGGTESVSASVGVSPWISFTETATKLRLAGDVRVTEYARVFSRTESFRISANGTWQLDPRLKLVSDISYGQSIVGETNLVENLTPGLILIEDPTTVGRRSRRRSLNTSLTAQFSPDARQAWSFSFYANESRFSNLLNGNDYAVFGETISYDRVLRRGTFGAMFNLQRYECRSGQSCTQIVASPQLTASLRLNASWTLSGTAGVSFSELNLPTQANNTITPAVSASLCRRDARASFCINAAHTVEATALNGARPIVSGGLSSSYRATERNTISLSGNYAASTRASLTGDTFRSFGARLTDEHRVGRNLHLVVVGSHSITDSSFLGRRSNTEMSIGVRISIGRNS